LTASSSLISHGVWVTRPSGLWVGIPTNASRPAPLGPNEHRLWVREQFPDRSERLWRMSVADSLLQLAVLTPATSPLRLSWSRDSALRTRVLTPDQMKALCAAMPRRFRRLYARLDGRADSGLETHLRLARDRI